MDLNESKFNQVFLKNLFKEILNEKGKHPEKVVNYMAESLSELFEKEFGSGNYPYKILSEHKNIQDWIDKKIDNMQ